MEMEWCTYIHNVQTSSRISCSGPIVLLRLELGVLSRGCVGPVELTCEYLRLGDVGKVRGRVGKVIGADNRSLLAIDCGLSSLSI